MEHTKLLGLFLTLYSTPVLLNLNYSYVQYIHAAFLGLGQFFLFLIVSVFGVHPCSLAQGRENPPNYGDLIRATVPSPPLPLLSHTHSDVHPLPSSSPSHPPRYAHTVLPSPPSFRHIFPHFFPHLLTLCGVDQPVIWL